MYLRTVANPCMLYQQASLLMCTHTRVDLNLVLLAVLNLISRSVLFSTNLNTSMYSLFDVSCMVPTSTC
jgi:hypothetical protein